MPRPPSTPALENIRASGDQARELLDDPQIEGLARSITNLSPAFSRLLTADELAIEVLRDLRVRRDAPDDIVALAPWCKREMLRIAARDLSGLDDVGSTGRLLADLATEVLDISIQHVDGSEELCIIGMGKLGAEELNYASDIDIMFVGSAPEKVARSVVEIARSCFRVDTNLRPEGRSGPLVRSVQSFETYWGEWAAPWEFQALLKANVLGGNALIGEAWSDAARRSLWSRHFDSTDLSELRRMKERSEQLAASHLRDNEVKRSSGGIRDVEFAVQLLQLVHGELDTELRTRGTLAALSALSAGGYVSEQDAEDLAACYSLLRNVEHRAQLVELNQTHSVPSDPVARERIAASLYMTLPRFDEELRRCRSTVRRAFERLYFRPLLESFSGTTTLDEITLQSRVSALGFADAQRTKIAVEELTEGLTRSSALMRQMMPLLLEWLSAAPNPDRGLLGLRKLVSTKRSPASLVAAFRDSPEVARRVCLLLGTSSSFETALARHPDLYDFLNHARPSVDSVSERMSRTLQWRTDPLGKRTTLARFNDGEKARISMNEVLSIADHETSCVARSALADSVLGHAIADLAGDSEVCVVALGRYGGEELGPASDLDVMIVHDGEQSEFEHLAQQLLKSVGNPSPAFGLYELDYSLRPEGKQGPLARSLSSCAEYYERWASPWERQALVRARYACGNPDVARDFFGIVEKFVWSGPLTQSDLREIRHLKARMESERIPAGEDPKFHLKMGKGAIADVEWTVQLLQLRHGIRSNNTLSALRQMRDEQILTTRDADTLDEAWRFCSEVRDRASLIESRQVNSLPTDRERLEVLGRSLGTTAIELQARFLRLARRCRGVTERLFYERTER